LSNLLSALSQGGKKFRSWKEDKKEQEQNFLREGYNNRSKLRIGRTFSGLANFNFIKTRPKCGLETLSKINKIK